MTVLWVVVGLLLAGCGVLGYRLRTRRRLELAAAPGWPRLRSGAGALGVYVDRYSKTVQSAATRARRLAAVAVDRAAAALEERATRNTGVRRATWSAPWVARSGAPAGQQASPVESAGSPPPGAGRLRSWLAGLRRELMPTEAPPPAPTVGAEPAPPPTPEATPETVLVLGSGSAAGVVLVDALRAAGLRTVAADHPSAGPARADEKADLPAPEDRAYPAAVVELARGCAASYLMPTAAVQFGPLTIAGPSLRDLGVRLRLPRTSAVDAARDPWVLAMVAGSAGVHAPATGLSRAEVPGPWVVRSRADSSVELKLAEADSEAALDGVPAPVLQSQVAGRRFTVELLLDDAGSPAASVPWFRVRERDGLALKGTTFADPALVSATVRLVRALSLTGAVSVHGVQAEDGTPWFTRVAIGFSDGLPLAVSAGADLISAHLAYLRGEQPSIATYRRRVGMARRWADVFNDGVPAAGTEDDLTGEVEEELPEPEPAELAAEAAGG
jgi:carbamoyl-phosphate synthase large subunit